MKTTLFILGLMLASALSFAVFLFLYNKGSEFNSSLKLCDVSLKNNTK